MFYIYLYCSSLLSTYLYSNLIYYICMTQARDDSTVQYDHMII